MCSRVCLKQELSVAHRLFNCFQGACIFMDIVSGPIGSLGNGVSLMFEVNNEIPQALSHPKATSINNNLHC